MEPSSQALLDRSRLWPSTWTGMNWPGAKWLINLMDLTLVPLVTTEVGRLWSTWGLELRCGWNTRPAQDPELVTFSSVCQLLCSIKPKCNNYVVLEYNSFQDSDWLHIFISNCNNTRSFLTQIYTSSGEVHVVVFFSSHIYLAGLLFLFLDVVRDCWSFHYRINKIFLFLQL